MRVHALVISGEGQDRQAVRRALESLDEVLVSDDAPSRLWDHLNRGDVDLVFMSQAGLSRTPAAVVATIRKLPEQPEVVALTDHEDGERRAELLAAGCLAVLNTGLAPDILRQAVAAMVGRRRQGLIRELGTYRVQERASLNDFISESPSMQRFSDLARRVVHSDSSLLLLGETGVGKERLASAIHHDGPRAEGPFLCVNCAALPESLLEGELFGHELGAFTGATRSRRGYFEQGHGGTIFLDEIAEIPTHVQVKLLRVLETRTVQRLGGEVSQKVDVRLMAATNRDLEVEVAAGRFRPDLYFRLAVVTLHVPPLRERREDIAGLVASYLDHFGAVLGRQPNTITARAMEALVRYDWPGNVRELINVIERTTLLAASQQIDVHDLPDEIVAPRRSGPGRIHGMAAVVSPDPGPWLDEPLFMAREHVLDAFHRAYLIGLLARHQGRMGESAQAAGINVRTLYYLMRKHGIRKEDFRS